MIANKREQKGGKKSEVRGTKDEVKAAVPRRAGQIALVTGDLE
jgi:hypothetical protein